MHPWKTRIRILSRAGTVAVCAAIAPALATAQNTISEDFTGTTLNNTWTAINGACLTAGTAANGSIPSCVGLQYYLDNGDLYQVGGQNGYLGDSSAPGSNAAQTPDPSGSGALRLTNGSPFYHESGAIVSTTPFDASSGVQVTFKTVTYLGDNGGTGGDGADGISFFLLDASKYASGSGVLGAWGGSLGYSCSNANPPYNGQIGAYVGLGIDEYGNFLNGGPNGSGGYRDNTATGVPANGWGSGDYQWNRIGLRGAGNVAWSWLNANYETYYADSLPSLTLTNGQNAAAAAVQKTCETGVLWNYSANPNNPTNTGISVPGGDYAPIPGASAVLSGVTIANESATTRSQATPIYYVLKITSAGQLSLSYSYNGGSLTQVLSNQSITASNGNLPSSLLFGFAGSTGGSDNVHEIMCFQAAPSDQSDSSTTVNLPQDKLLAVAQVYLPSYHTSNWWGQLTAQNISLTASNTVVISATVNWDASCVLTGGPCPSMNNAAIPVEGPSSRTILTWNGTNGAPFEWTNLSTAEQNLLDTGVPSTGTSNRLEYLRGDRSNEIPPSNPTASQIYRDRTSVLGDIIHSAPVWVGPPTNVNYDAAWTDNLYPSAGAAENSNNYQNFANAYAGRENVVYIGANDGMLHGFRSGSMSGDTMITTSYPNDGGEVLAYMPGALVQSIHTPSTSYDYSSPQYSHTYGVDAPPRARDLFYSGAWHTWLTGGLGAGGSAIYALDVTDPSQFSETNAAAVVKGEWNPSTLFCANVANCGLNLGNTYGTPVVWRFHAATGGSDMWGMAFGNGFPNTIVGSISNTFTGSIGNPITGQIGQQFTGSISGTTLTVTAGNILSVGQVVSGTGVRAGTKVTGISGGSCSANPCTYTVNRSQRISSEPMYTSSTTLYVTNSGSGITNLPQPLSGPGVVAGTSITAQLTGTSGGVGTYTVSISQSVASTHMQLPGPTLTVTAGGGIVAGQTITGPGVAAGTTVTAVVSGNGGPGTYTVSTPQLVATTQMSNGVTTLTATAGNGITVGQTITGGGVAAGTKITSAVTGTGGPGIYVVNNSQSIASSPLTVGSSTGTAGIYVMLIDPGSGQQSVYYLDTGYGPNQDPTGQGRANGIAYVTLADLDGDNTADYAYAGDLFGNLWRFDLTSNNPSAWSASGFGGSGPRPLFSAPVSVVNGVNVSQPVTSKPIVWQATQATGGNAIIVIFGTGQENPLTPVSAVTYAAGPQSLYGIWDWDMANWNALSKTSLAFVSESQYASAVGGPLSASSLTTQTLTQSGTQEWDTNNTVCWYGGNLCSNGNTSFGWKIALQSNGEQVIYNPTIWQGNLQVNTTVPSTSTIFSCSIQLPTGWTLMINPTTGGGFPNSSFLGTNGVPMTVGGMPVAGVQLNATGSITNISAGGQSVGVTQTVSNTPATFNEKAAPAGVGHRVTWTELR